MATRPPDMTEFKKFLRLGRHDYDYVAGAVYAACYNDPHVIEKILAAEPGDVPDSEVEDAVPSHEECSDSEADNSDIVPPEEEEAQSVKQSGSKEDPVVLDAKDGDDNKENKPSKRKRTENEAKDGSSAKKSKYPDTLFLCLNCGGKSNPNKNEEGVCHFHPERTVLGELEDNPTCEDISDDEDSRET